MTERTTDLGKALRRLRIDLDIPMRVMAKSLGFSVSFLSAIELGKKTISDPIKFIDRIAMHYELGFDRRAELDDAAAKSCRSAVLPMDRENGELMLGLSRVARDPENIERLREFLHEFEKK